MQSIYKRWWLKCKGLRHLNSESFITASHHSMNPNKSEVNPADIYDLCFGWAKTEVLYATTQLHIHDHLKGKPQTIEEMAKTINVPTVHLEKLMNGAAHFGLLEKKNDVFTNSPSANKYLAHDDPESICDFVTMTVEMNKGYMGSVKSAVETGKIQVIKNNDIFKGMEQMEELRQVFQSGMAVVAKTGRQLAGAFDLSEYKKSIDIGGGTGTFARALAERYPKMDVGVVDLERVCVTAKTLPLNKNSRVTFTPGDFFAGDLPEADLYSICHVLHDWDDASCEKILKNVAKAVKPGGAILILDNIFESDKTGPRKATLTEVAQIAHHEGKHRTFEEFEELLAAQGFTKARRHRTEGFSFYDALIATRS